jgi:hypothetical protein
MTEAEALTSIATTHDAALAVIPVVLIVALAFWQKSNFLFILGGMLAIGFGAYWINLNDNFMHLMVGIVAVGIGLYMLITTAFDMFKSKASQ